ncbi:MAG: hypothetical protein U0559_08815 [Anaerolineae bacterium]
MSAAIPITANTTMWPWRAVAALPVLAEYLLPLVKVGGVAIAQKSKDLAEEIERAETAILLLGGLDAEVKPIPVPGLPDERNLIVIDSLAATPDEYPRRVGALPKARSSDKPKR